MRRLWEGLVLSLAVSAAPAAAADFVRPPNTLIVGDQGVSVVSKEHLTIRDRVSDFAWCPRGELLAYTARSHGVCVVGLVPWAGPRPLTAELPAFPGPVCWSVEGDSLLVSTSGRKSEGAALWLVAVSIKGPESAKLQPRKIFSAPEIRSSACSSKAERVAVACRQLPQRPGEDGAKELVLVNLRDDSRQSLGEWGEGLSFDAGGRFLSYQTAEQQADGSTTPCRVVYDLETGEKKRQQQAGEDRHPSPDGARIAQAITGKGTDLVVREMASGNAVRLTWNGASTFAGWSPDSQIVAYIRGYPVTDDRRETVTTVPTLWLAAAVAPEAGRQMIVGVVDADSPVKWSNDGKALAFLAEGDLCVAYLARGPLGVKARIALGMPVTDEAIREAIRQVAVSNGRQIALALIMYAHDHNDTFPGPGTDIEEAIAPYLKSHELFCHPAQPDQFIFKYLPPQETSLRDIADPATTPLGTLDVDAEWEAVCFADGRAMLRRKPR